MGALLLDTCAVIWVAQGERLREPAASELKRKRKAPLFVSPITAWEIGTLVSKGKISLAIDPEAWFASFCELPGVTLTEMPPSVLMASACLPGAPPADPADRILIATTRAFGYTLVTRDKPLLEYGNCGHIKVMGC